MKKLLAALLVGFVVVLGTLSTATAAQAYPDVPPKGNVTPPTAPQGGPAPGAALPSTGGPDGALLLGGVALLVVGAGATVVARRRSSASE